MITASEPPWTAPHSGPGPKRFGKPAAVLRRGDPPAVCRAARGDCLWKTGFCSSPRTGGRTWHCGGRPPVRYLEPGGRPDREPVQLPAATAAARLPSPKPIHAACSGRPAPGSRNDRSSLLRMTGMAQPRDRSDPVPDRPESNAGAVAVDRADHTTPIRTRSARGNSPFGPPGCRTTYDGRPARTRTRTRTWTHPDGRPSGPRAVSRPCRSRTRHTVNGRRGPHRSDT